MRKQPLTGGNCFNHTSEMALNRWMPQGFKLVHGYVYNPAIPGWMGHAWIESEDLVMDVSKNAQKPIILQKDRYYKEARRNHPECPKEIRSYTTEEACALMYKYLHKGPWPSNSFKVIPFTIKEK